MVVVVLCLSPKRRTAKNIRFCRETLEMMDAKGKRLDVLDLTAPTLPFTPTFGLVAASCMVNDGKGR